MFAIARFGSLSLALLVAQAHFSICFGQDTARPRGEPATRPTGAWRPGQPASDADVYAALERPIPKITYQGTPLGDVIRDLRERLGVNVHVQAERLAACKIELSQPVTLTLKHLPAKRVLRLVLEDVNPKLQLGYEVLEGVLVISDRTMLDRQLVLRTYLVRDLLTREPQLSESDPKEEAYVRLAYLIAAITDSIAPDSWAANGGNGELQLFRGVLTVYNTPAVQEQVKALLDAIRSIPKGGSTAVPPVPAEQQRMDEPIRAALQSTLPTVDYDGVPLARVVDDLRRRFDINVHVFSEGMRDSDIGDDKPVRLHLTNVTAQRMLTQVLSDLGESVSLRFEIDAGVLAIGREGEVGCHQTLCVYDVQDLAPTDDLRSRLVQLIADVIDRDSWICNGGNGAVNFIGSVLVVRQSIQTQMQVDAFLRELRQRLQAKPATSQP